MTSPTLSILPLDQIAPSRTNPRKHFDAARLEELAASIRESGVHTPVLVRPLPAHRLEDTAGMDPRPQWELIAGERRLRASAMAGVATIPALVRAMTDGQVLEAQIVENLQRDDLTELEEAEGYEALMQHGTAEDGTRPDALAVANKIGKSKSYVYARLKLLDLCTEARDALRAGHIDASRALLIARIPDSKLQIKALHEATRKDYHGDIRSVRSLGDWCQSNVMLRLDAARFKITDADLVPAAGSCKACPKRTGANPDLFADVKAADVCTDPACYRAKEDAQHARTLAEATERGQTVITGREAKTLIPHSYTSRVEGHLRLDDIQDSPDNKKTIRQLLGKHLEREGVQPILIENPHTPAGTKPDLIAVLPHDQAAQLLRAAGRDEYAQDAEAKAQRSAKEDKAQQASKAKAAYEEGWRLGVVERIAAHLVDRPDSPCVAGTDVITISAKLLRHLALAEVQRLRADQAQHIARLLGLGKVAPKEGIATHVTEADADWLPGLTLLLLARQDVQHMSWLPQDHKAAGNPELHLAAELCAIDIKAVQADTQAAIKAKTKAAAEKAKAKEAGKSDGKDVGKDAPPPDTARPKLKPGAKGKAPSKPSKPSKPKTTPEEAQAGIAQAMQAATASTPPLAPGLRVRINPTASGKGKEHVGRLGRISEAMGDRAWMVILDPKRRGGVADTASFDYSELEAAEA